MLSFRGVHPIGSMHCITLYIWLMFNVGEKFLVPWILWVWTQRNATCGSHTVAGHPQPFPGKRTRAAFERQHPCDFSMVHWVDAFCCWWLNQPIWKNKRKVKLDHFTTSRGENKQMKSSPSFAVSGWSLSKDSYAKGTIWTSDESFPMPK